MELTQEERKAIIKNINLIGTSFIEIALILEGAEQGYFGGVLEPKRTPKDYGGRFKAGPPNKKESRGNND